MDKPSRPATWKVLAAYSVIYFVWGSTFLAIRIGVHEIPPFLMAAIRFSVAGLLLYAWMRFKGVPALNRRQWAAASLMGALIFLIDYGCLFWSEQRVPSGIAAVILAMIPVFITLLEIAILGTQRLTVRLAAALVVGVFGVLVLMNNSLSIGEAPVDRAGALALLVAAFTWSLATILSRKLPLPKSKPMSAAAQMLIGGIQLTLLAVFSGECAGFRFPAVSWNAWLALLYLIVPGSIVGFTAYIWLLHYESPSKVGTYAFVNPVIAVLLGYAVGDEGLGPRTLIGTAFILASVIAITTTSILRPASNS